MSELAAPPEWEPTWTTAYGDLAAVVQERLQAIWAHAEPGMVECAVVAVGQPQDWGGIVGPAWNVSVNWAMAAHLEKASYLRRLADRLYELAAREESRHVGEESP